MLFSMGGLGWLQGLLEGSMYLNREPGPYSTFLFMEFRAQGPST